MKRNNLLLTAAVGLAAALLFTAQVSAQDTVRLQGHVLDVLPMAVRMNRTPQSAQEPIALTLMLNWSDQAAFDEYRKAFETPGSPSYRKRLSADEFKKRFSPTQTAYDSVLAWLQRNGFTLTEGSDNRVTLTVRGTRAQAERAFAVTIDDYLMGSRQFHAIAADPAIPAALAPFVRSVSGFSNLAVPQPAANALSPQAISQAYNGTLTAIGNQVSTGPGVLPPGVNGSGQTIALLEWDSFNPTDVSYWLSQVGLPANLINQVTIVPVNGGTNPSGCNIANAGCGETEVLLDIGGALGVAQGANIAVLVTPNQFANVHAIVTNYTAMVNAAVNYLNKGNNGGAISDSWSICEAETSASDQDSMEALLQSLPISGYSFFVAAGDNGSTCVSPQGTWPNSVDFPSNAPSAVAVGATDLQPAADGSYGTESWWFNNNGGVIGTSGFGVSAHFPRPGYQDNFTTASGRSVPDVSAMSSPGILVCQNAVCLTEGGTSLATPIWAAIWTLGLEAESLARRTVDAVDAAPAGNLIYAWGSFLHSPSSMTGTGNDFAHLGMGTPDITNIVSLMAGAPSINNVSPASGSAAGGTTVVISGHAFIGVSSVQFGGVPATSFTVDSESQITAISPASAVSGDVGINVQTPAGTSAAYQFKYLPAILGINPNSGPLTGLTFVTVTGDGFAKGANAPFFFGGVAATNVQCSTTTQCTMLTPAHAVATVDVTYTGAEPSSVQFTFYGPTLTSISPNTGGENGGTTVNLVGTGLSENMIVHFGNTNVSPNCPEPEAQNQSVTGCTVSSPPGSGSVHVTFTIDGVTTPPTAAAIFTYKPLPYGTMSPSQGPYPGGTVVTVTGGNFNTTPGATQFLFGANAATNVKCSSTACTMTTPPIPAAPAAASQGGVVQVSATANGLTGTIGPFDYTGVQPKQKPIPCKGICQ